jgi:hypothetical protein
MLIRDSDIKRDDDEEEGNDDDDDDEDASFLSRPLFFIFFENFFPLFSLAFSPLSVDYLLLRFCPSLPVFYTFLQIPLPTPLTCLKKEHKLLPSSSSSSSKAESRTFSLSLPLLFLFLSA